MSYICHLTGKSHVHWQLCPAQPWVTVNLLFVPKFMEGHDLGLGGRNPLCLASFLTCGQGGIAWQRHCSSFLFLTEELCCLYLSSSLWPHQSIYPWLQTQAKMTPLSPSRVLPVWSLSLKIIWQRIPDLEVVQGVNCRRCWKKFQICFS